MTEMTITMYLDRRAGDPRDRICYGNPCHADPRHRSTWSQKYHIGQGNYRAIVGQLQGRGGYLFAGPGRFSGYDRHWAVGMRGMAYRHDMECTENLGGTLQTTVESQGAVQHCADQDCQSGSWIRPRLQHSSDIAMVSDKCNAAVVSSRSFVHNRTVPGTATATATTTAVGIPSIPLVSPANPPFTERRAGLPQVDMRASYTTPETPTTATTLAQQMLRSRDHLGSQTAADFMFCLSRPLSRLGSILHP